MIKSLGHRHQAHALLVRVDNPGTGQQALAPFNQVELHSLWQELLDITSEPRGDLGFVLKILFQAHRLRNLRAFGLLAQQQRRLRIGSPRNGPRTGIRMHRGGCPSVSVAVAIPTRRGPQPEKPLRSHRTLRRGPLEVRLAVAKPT